MNDVTRILNTVEQGDAQAMDELLPLVYRELRAFAAYRLAQEAPGQTLQPTALVHDAYLRLVGASARTYSSSRHFFRAAAEAMRRILIDRARHKQRIKRGGNFQRTEFDETLMAIEPPSEDIIALDEALTELSEEEPVVAELVKLRYFAGLTLKQAAQLLEISNRAATRYWAYARARLFEQLSEGQE